MIDPTALLYWVLMALFLVILLRLRAIAIHRKDHPDDRDR